MQKLMRGTLVAFVFFYTLQSFAGVLGFREWKQRRIAEKTSIISQIKNDKLLSKEERALKLKRAQFNLKTETELTPDDYFHLYLSERFRNNPEKSKEAARKLSKEELAEILVGYVVMANQSRGAELFNPNPLQTSR